MKVKVAQEGGLNRVFKKKFAPKNLNKFSQVCRLGLQKHFRLATKL